MSKELERFLLTRADDDTLTVSFGELREYIEKVRAEAVKSNNELHKLHEKNLEKVIQEGNHV